MQLKIALVNNIRRRSPCDPKLTLLAIGCVCRISFYKTGKKCEDLIYEILQLLDLTLKT
jgi:hypothetical protein